MADKERLKPDQCAGTARHMFFEILQRGKAKTGRAKSRSIKVNQGQSRWIKAMNIVFFCVKTPPKSGCPLKSGPGESIRLKASRVQARGFHAINRLSGRLPAKPL
jgi:hypothetical protein